MKRLTALAMVLALSVGAGCSKAEPPLLEAWAQPQIKVLYENASLAQAISLTHSALDTTARLPRAVVTLKNTSPNALYVNYQVEWRDGYGASQSVTPARHTSIIPSNCEKTIASYASFRQAKMVVLTVTSASPAKVFIPY